ncbi:MAG: hypothetical protein IJN03_01230 [Bacilli bacterium]|nr:hypothetical protein [Bacilli bacterium]
MNYKAMIKKQTTIIAIAVICLTIATIGVSYALFFQVETNSNDQVVTAGSLNVSYGSGSSSISATGLVPMSDEEALLSQTMTGTIYVENKGSLPAEYEVAIGNDLTAFEERENKSDDDELLSHDYLRIAAYLNGELKVEPTSLSALEASSHSENSYKLFDGTLDTTGTGNSTMTIVIKIWVSEEAPEAVIGDFVYLKMDLTSEVDEFTAEGGEYKTVSGTQSLVLNNSLGYNLVNYKIYGNSIQNGTPSLNTPVDVQSVGEKTDNIWDEQWEVGNIQVGNIVNGSNYYRSKNYIRVKPSTTYTFNIGQYDNIYVFEYDTNKNYLSKVTRITTNNHTFTTNADTHYVLFTNRNTNTYGNDVIISEGNVDKEYEPYGYKIPVIAKGKNQIQFPSTDSSVSVNYVDGATKTTNGITFTVNKNGSVNVKGTATGDAFFNLMKQDLKQADSYMLSGGSTGKSDTTANLSISKYVTYQQSNSLTYIHIPTGTTINETLYPQLENGTKITTYEQYTKPITTNVYLDEPLRAIGTNRDYIDFEKQTISRIINTHTFDGSERWTKYSNNPETYPSYHTVFNEAPNANGLHVMCNRYEAFNAYANFWYGKVVGCYLGNVNVSNTMFVIGSESATVEEFVAALQTNPIDIIYVMNKEEATPLELPDISTVKGTTILQIDTSVQPNNVEITYK